MGKHVLPKRPFFSISILQWRIYRAEPTNDWQDRRNIEKVPIQRSAFSSLPIIKNPDTGEETPYRGNNIEEKAVK